MIALSVLAHSSSVGKRDKMPDRVLLAKMLIATPFLSLKSTLWRSLFRVPFNFIPPPLSVFYSSLSHWHTRFCSFTLPPHRYYQTHTLTQSQLLLLKSFQLYFRFSLVLGVRFGFWFVHYIRYGRKYEWRCTRMAYGETGTDRYFDR